MTPSLRSRDQTPQRPHSTQRSYFDSVIRGGARTTSFTRRVTSDHELDEEDRLLPRDPRRYSRDIDDDGDDADDNQASDEDGHDNEAAPLLPIFSAAHLGSYRITLLTLDSLPIYNITHLIRLLIVQRCETTLTWDQLRSPQISQFLVKPIQQQIRSNHFSRATLYALVANCLQFNKEATVTPGNMGVLRTRALVSELLATRLLREFTTRELIDALSYDFDPLQGAFQPRQGGSHAMKRSESNEKTRGSVVRTSTLEVAIRAQAKRFLAHPLTVQHLEAIWAGTICFHSRADNLHRYPSKPPMSNIRHYGATHNSQTRLHDNQQSRLPAETVRRSVTLYNPNDASLFKLSRLRVPKYRNTFSTLSYAVMLGLFVSVLAERDVHIDFLEVLFWCWSAGFMLDELVGFSEQGFSLYIISVWNAFDIGILLLFFMYYVLRLYSLLVSEDDKQYMASIAYDVLATTAVLLFPRLFSLLDHYRYFSQLLIAFRLMAQDLAAILVLIAISCSGFFVAFTLSFGRQQYNGSSVAFALFQILMGFTPAAWDVWPQYNLLGKAILGLFLIICHFLVVTILITVLTNSFMAIVKNANEEHQFLFAVNVLSMVKSDALFSYIAPFNILGWSISPLRYIIPFRYFVKVNRTLIKITHFPLLFLIFFYEKFRLGRYAYEPAILVERKGLQGKLPTFMGQDPGPLTPTVRVREPSLMTRYKDRALEEVFLRVPGETVRRNSGSRQRRASAVDNWMDNIGDVTSPPVEDHRSILERLEVSRAGVSAGQSAHRSVSRSLFSGSNAERQASANYVQSTEGDGDDELLTHDEDEHEPSIHVASEGPTSPPVRQSTPRPRFVGWGHNRHASISTIVHTPEPRDAPASYTSQGQSRSAGGNLTNALRPTSQAKRSSRPMTAVRARPIMPKRGDFQSAPNLARFMELARNTNRQPSFDAIALDLASDIGDNRPNENVTPLVAGSFTTTNYGSGAMARKRAQRDREKADESNMMSRIVLARMNTLEEGFKDILKEVKDWRNASSRGTSVVDKSSPPMSGMPSRTVSQRRLARKLEKSKLADDSGEAGGRGDDLADSPADTPPDVTPMIPLLDPLHEAGRAGGRSL